MKHTKKNILGISFVLLAFFVSVQFAHAVTQPAPVWTGGEPPQQQNTTGSLPPAQGSGSQPSVQGTGSRPPAQGSGSQSSKIIPSLKNPLQVTSVQDLLAKVVDYAIFLGLIFATLVFIFIGFKFITAQGDTKAIADARNWFLWAVIGTALLISARIIVDVVKNTSIEAGLVDPKVFNKP